MRVPNDTLSAPTELPYMWYQKDRQRGALSAVIVDVVNNTAFCPENCGGDVSMNM